ncbi:Lrp/AsnC family transcriptional regulator [Microlunatus parietis]|uniref:DNA-binding Lrp family transcriptional regulator n=1 Tax=Microlunatus parietis TaxID=682979 RepID=A0A7Y9LCG5_9ACTN|nr:Lrp/AsnC family transcriptional regulator [Microlunatus parietis]NYE70891.1 DNA-binding Lrp family transcriptional regulator [Microlunatus parietis]
MDGLDEQIIHRLAGNARATFAEIGAEVGLSAPAVKRRVDRLVADGTIAGFTAMIDPAALGWGTEAYVQVYCKGTISPENLLRIWEPIPEIVSASTITGGADAILRVRARDVQHLERALERIREDDTVERTESIIVLSRLIERG